MKSFNGNMYIMHVSNRGYNIIDYKIILVKFI